MAFGSDRYKFEVVEGWFKPPKGWHFGWIPAVACDFQGRVFVYSRSEHPLVILDSDGNFIDEWGVGILKDAHGIWIDAEGNVYCTERNNHCVFKFNPKGKLVMTLGTPGKPAEREGEPFNAPTDTVTVKPNNGNAPLLLCLSRMVTETPASTSSPQTVNSSSHGADKAAVQENSTFLTASELTDTTESGFATERTGASRFLTLKATT